MRCLFLIAAVLLCVPNASAADWHEPGDILPSRVMLSRIMHDLRVADIYWPASGCHGRVRVHVRADLPPGIDGRAVGALPTPDGGLEVMSCDMQVSERVLSLPNPSRACKVIVHEAGHLAGLVHSTTGIMRPDADVPVPLCEPSVGELMTIQTREFLPRNGAGWRVRCSARKHFCVATRGHQRWRWVGGLDHSDGSVMIFLVSRRRVK